jgi:hypothetical protein
MKKIFLLAISVSALVLAATKSYSVELYQPAMLGGATLSPGTYTVQVTDQTAVVRNGKIHGEAPVKVEMTDSEYSTTTVRFSNSDGKMHIQEIHVGGTKTKLVFSE